MTAGSVADAVPLLPDRLSSLAGYVIERVLNEGTEPGGFVVVLGHFPSQPEVKVLVRLKRLPLPGNGPSLERLLHGTAVELRMPYSGAEYGYYHGRDTELPSLNIEVISPHVVPDADKLLEKLIIKSSSQTNYLVRETPELYAAAHVPRIAAIPASNLAWISNVLAKEKEVDRLLLDVPGDDGFLLNTDPKWTSHPTSTDRSTWKHHASVKDLYCLGLVRTRIASIRDLRARHLPLLRAMREQGLSVIESSYGVPHHQIRAFFHYPPQFYHLHVHFTSLTTDMGSGCHIERAHLLDDVIDNLAQDGEFYARSNITIRLGEKDPLWANIQAAQEATS